MMREEMGRDAVRVGDLHIIERVFTLTEEGQKRWSSSKVTVCTIRWLILVSSTLTLMNHYLIIGKQHIIIKVTAPLI